MRKIYRKKNVQVLPGCIWTCFCLSPGLPGATQRPLESTSKRLYTLPPTPLRHGISGKKQIHFPPKNSTIGQKRIA